MKILIQIIRKSNIYWFQDNKKSNLTHGITPRKKAAYYMFIMQQDKHVLQSFNKISRLQTQNIIVDGLNNQFW